mmetsp:Transcript_34564/g.62191  ORF Transcript_34564/g.62191 Transcript_34564/m.62191 type:complete len:381 (-) Transcript_34564:145-1287(-)|eukprot:CAMPEP_0201896426 /NCGR_PEP_ID=MMETSP0902-20130614/44620_1 /ASSEMBLY_ACC=CAM_ASM_000551 /TAXON_ID=420261 /ORGANISM="Thalassiosira antarctica, Strain CCMP982" /LENGTH=380 /DNA_ID=CAMNT_0048429023 /DNA_START=62 /DNA_END=1204 /DNA_ORIENTATION=-
MELSDDVSALSMDGASAIAGKVFARRLRKDFAEMQLGIPEDEEQQAAAAVKNGHNIVDGTPGSKSSSALLQEQENSRTDGEELLEPFPKTFEEWQKKKEKKKKHKSKKHDRKSSKSGSRRSKDRDKEQQQHSESSNSKALHIMEISIQSTNFQPSRPPSSPSRRHSNHLGMGSVSDSRSYHSSVASSASSHSRSSHRQLGSSLNGSGEAMGRAVTRSLQHQTSCRSMDHRSSLRSVDSGHSTYMTKDSTHSQSLITVDDLQQLRVNFECAKMDEKQVLDIHKRLEKEIESVMQKADKAKSQQQAVSLELQSASLEREHLQIQFGIIQDENSQLRSKLRYLEEKESEKGLDDVMDSMGAKIKALKLKSRRSKEKEKEQRST